MLPLNRRTFLVVAMFNIMILRSILYFQCIFTLKRIDKKAVYGSGKLEEIKQRVRQGPGVSAVFLSINMLSGLQLATLQREWNVPVYDR